MNTIGDGGCTLEIFQEKLPYQDSELVATAPDDTIITLELFNMIEQKLAFASKALDGLLSDDEEHQ